MTEADSEAIAAAAVALPPMQRAAFCRLVASSLESLPEAMLGPGTLYRVIAACQKSFLCAGSVAVGPAPEVQQVGCNQVQGQVSLPYSDPYR